MEFRIKEIILWPTKEGLMPRRLKFELDKVNVITGDSERGKSSLIAIVDYALCSSKCQIPVGIRPHVSWFGVLIQMNDKQVLLARKEPGLNKVEGSMFKKELPEFENIPDKIEKTHNVEDVKSWLNAQAKLSDLGVGSVDGIDGPFDSRPSFRDLVSFMFQPQYIIANQRTLFYKTDTYEHREKVRSIFPYILKAVDNEDLYNRERLKRLKQESKVLEREYSAISKTVEKWIGQIRGFYMMAKEYGLLQKRPYPSEDWLPKHFIQILGEIPNAVNKKGIPNIVVGSTTVSTERLNQLRNQENSLAVQTETLRSKQTILRNISSTNAVLSDGLLSQHGRLGSVGWFSKLIQKSSACPMCGNDDNHNHDYLRAIHNESNRLERQLGKSNDTRVVFDSELNKVETELKEKEEAINAVRQEVRSLFDADETMKKAHQTEEEIYRFVGRLEAQLDAYNDISDDGKVVQELNKLSIEIAEIEEKINEDTVRAKLKNALNRVQRSISYYAEMFKAERSDEPLYLNTKDLTLNFGSDQGRSDALWEIGSGSNYMAYHVSTLLGLHEFFLRYKDHPVPAVLFLDQPSQAYFPEMRIKSEDQLKAGIPGVNQEDITRVQRIFNVLSNCVSRTKGKLQIIVLEHAGPSIWKDIDSVHLVARWRDDEEDKALIPHEWMN